MVKQQQKYQHLASRTWQSTTLLFIEKPEGKKRIRKIHRHQYKYNHRKQTEKQSIVVRNALLPFNQYYSFKKTQQAKR